jgi:hypothetical protein
VRSDGAGRAERRRSHLERFGEIDEAVAAVQRDLEAATAQRPEGAPGWDEVTLAAVRSLLGLVQRHRAGDLVLLEPVSGLAVRVRSEGGTPSAALVAVPPPVDEGPAAVVDPLPAGPVDDPVRDDPAPPPDDGPGRGPLRALHPDVREELEERRRTARERFVRPG